MFYYFVILFQDALYNPQADNMAFIRNVWLNDISTQKNIKKETHKVLQNHSNPMAYALSELLKGQLELTSHFLNSQKTLYANYCANLDKILLEPPAKHEDFEKVIFSKRYQEAKDTPNQNEEEYESEFETDSAEEEEISEENSNVLTEITVETE